MYANVYQYVRKTDSGGNYTPVDNGSPSLLSRVTTEFPSPRLWHIRFDGDDVFVSFAVALSGAEQTTLDTCVSDWTPSDISFPPVGPKDKRAQVDPGVSDDGSSGYGVGSRWINTSNKRIFMSTDDTDDAAVWEDITASPSPLEVTAASEAKTTSTSDVLVGAMTLTPPAGNYTASFSGSGWSSRLNRASYYSIYVDGVQVQHSERRQNIFADGLVKGSPLHTQAQVTVNGSQAVEVRFRSEHKLNTFTVNERSLVLTRSG